MSRTFWQSFIASSLLVAAAACGEELPLNARPGASIESDIPRLVSRLDEPDFTDRQEASRKLAEAGVVVVPYLEQAAASGSREASARALDILKQHVQRGDGATRLAAHDTLKRLAGSDRASIAQRARNVLNPPPEPSIGSRNVGVRVGAFRQANVQIQIGAAGRRVQIQEANGRRTVEVEEAGRRVKMQTLPNGRIEFEMTEKQNGRDINTKLEATDLDDLRRKDAEAGRLYEQFGRGAVIRLGAAPARAFFPGAAIPIPVVPAAPAAAPFLKRALETIDASLRR